MGPGGRESEPPRLTRRHSPLDLLSGQTVASASLGRVSTGEPSTQRRAVVVYNPVAGHGLGPDVAARAERALVDAGWSVECRPTCDRRGAEPIAREVADSVDMLVVAGGDGSLREAIAGLGEARSRVPIGLIPLGNANVVAVELGVPLDADGAIAVLASGAPVELDIGRVRGDDFEDLFLAVVGVGWDAQVVDRMDCWRHGRVGGWLYRVWADGLYAVAGLLAAFRAAPGWFRLEADGADTAARYCAAFLCNLRTYAKRLAVAPEAHGASGRLHFQGRKRSLFVFLAWSLWCALRGRRAPASISDYGAGRTLTLVAERPVPIEIDGDYRGRSARLDLAIEPAAVRIVAPAQAAERVSTSRNETRKRIA